jgi:hypothetical protein
MLSPLQQQQQQQQQQQLNTTSGGECKSGIPRTKSNTYVLAS